MKRLHVVGFIRSPLAAAGLAAAFLCLAPMPSARAEAEGADIAVSQGGKEASARADIFDKEIAPLISDGEQLSADGKFEAAKAKFDLARKDLDKLGAGKFVADKQEQVKRLSLANSARWGKSELENARAQYTKAQRETDAKKSEKGFNDAIALANHAQLINPGLKDAATSFVADCNSMLAAKNFKESTSLETIDPNNAVRKEEILLLIKQSQILYKNKQYAKVRDNMEKVIIKDPYNEEAIRLLEKVYKNLYKIADARRDNEVLERLNEATWKWSNAILPTENVAPKIAGPVERKSAKSSLYDKLQKIVFDEIEFEDANLPSIISYLNTKSKEIDPDKTGVNIALQMSPDESANLQKITMSFENIPMSEAIRYLCQSAGLKYRVEDKAVLIGKNDIDDMDTRFFQVRAALISTISGGTSDTDEVTTTGGALSGATASTSRASTATATAGGTGTAANPFSGTVKDLFTGTGTATTTTTGTATSDALKRYFRDRGVPFDEGSAIAYEKRAGKLTVKNTPENLRKLEALLRDLDIQTPLVLIEAKILEISELDLEELGFDWVLSQRPDSLANTGTSNSPNYNYYYNTDYFVQPTDKVNRSYDSLADLNSTSSSTGYKMVNNLSVLPNVIKGFDVNLTVNAIQQNTRSEVLSSPKVTTTSGTTAVIRMVTEMYFPTSWNEPDTSIGNNTFEYTPSYPEFGEATDVGIRFEVTPTVSPNNYTISLHLYPQVVGLSGWTDYSYPVAITGTSGNQSQNTTLSALLKMPEISRRDITTNVKVYDGETIVLGGMLKEKAYQRDDKFPGIGEVPLIGRFFGSQMSYTAKTNLLIFVQSRLMSSDGVPVRSNPANGIFEFNR